MSLPGVNVLLMGPSGTGKTTALKTLIDYPGIEVFALFTEPRYDILGPYLDKIHWRYIAPATPSWGALSSAAKMVNTMSNDALQKLNSISGPEYLQYVDVLALCNNFIDQHGKEFGDVLTWPNNRVFVLDGLTGLSKMARKLKAGTKPILTQPDWGVCMTMIQEFVDTLVMGTFCHFILIGHVEKEVDEITGGGKTMVSTMGRKLAPLIPPNFGDVIQAKKDGNSFTWSTAEPQTDLKGGFLPNNGKLAPSFAPLLDQWKAQGGVLGTEKPANWQKKTGK